MCLLSVLLIGIGAVNAVTGLVHTIAPDLGHRDTIDRVGIGVANIATEVVGILEETDEEAVDRASADSITDGIAEVKDELQSQIRNNSIDQLIRGLLFVGAGVLLFQIHGNRTELFAGGLTPKRPPSAAGVPPATVPRTAPPPAPPAVPPPPPPAAPPPTVNPEI